MPKTAISPLGPGLKTRFQLDTMFPDPGTKLMKMGAFSLVVNLEDSDVGKYEFGPVLTVYCYSALYTTPLPSLMKPNLDSHSLQVLLSADDCLIRKF